MKQYAKQAGLDPEAAWKAAADEKYTDLVNADVEEGQKLQVASTPTIYVNGRQNVLPASAELLAWTIDDELDWIARGKSWSAK